MRAVTASNNIKLIIIHRYRPGSEASCSTEMEELLAVEISLQVANAVHTTQTASQSVSVSGVLACHRGSCSACDPINRRAWSLPRITNSDQSDETIARQIYVFCFRENFVIGRQEIKWSMGWATDKWKSEGRTDGQTDRRKKAGGGDANVTLTTHPAPVERLGESSNTTHGHTASCG